MVLASNAGDSEFQGRAGARVRQRPPGLPDRTPLVSRSPLQPLPRDRRSCAAAVRQVRPAIHDRFALAPNSVGGANNPQIGTSRPLLGRNVRRRARDRFGTEIPLRRRVTYRPPWVWNAVWSAHRVAGDQGKGERTTYIDSC